VEFRRLHHRMTLTLFSSIERTIEARRRITTGRSQISTASMGVREASRLEEEYGNSAKAETLPAAASLCTPASPIIGTYDLRVSSVRPVESGRPTPPPSTSDWYIAIFDRPSYQGNPTNYNETEANIFKLARSVTIGRGVWELCQGRNFTGRCITLSTSVPDLRSHNLRQVASLRPVTRQPRSR
jgi:beta/gamma crystallin